MANPMFVYLGVAAIIVVVVTSRTVRVKNAETKNHPVLRRFKAFLRRQKT
jgi:hypothetical protein